MNIDRPTGMHRTILGSILIALGAALAFTVEADLVKSDALTSLDDGKIFVTDAAGTSGRG